MAEVKYIFKNQLIGEPRFQKVLRNRIQGVSGEMLDVTPTPRNDGSAWGSLSGQPNIITSTKREDMYEHGIHGRVVEGESTIWGTNYFNSTHSFKFNYSSKVTQMRVSARLVYNDYDYYFNGNPQTNSAARLIATDLSNLARLLPDNEFKETLSMGTPLNLIENPEIMSTTKYVNIPLENFKENSFEISFDINYNATQSYACAAILWSETHLQITYNVHEPLYIEIIVRGDTNTFTPQKWHVGKNVDVFEFPKNTLLTTKSTFKQTDGTEIPLYEHLANQIIDKWHNGKQTVEIVKVINENSDLMRKGDKVKLMNTREIDFIGDSQSYSKHSNGVARVFEVDSCNMIYRGTLTQELKLSEHILPVS